MTQHLKNKVLLLILISFISFGESFGQESDSKKCNISIVLEAFQNKDQISEGLMLNFLKTFGKDCRNNVEFSEFINETLYQVIQQNPEIFAKTLENNLKQIDFDEIIFNLESPLHDLIDLDLTINKIADTEIEKSIKDKLIIAINSANWEESKKLIELADSTVLFFRPNSIQFDSIMKLEDSEGIYEVASDFGFYASKIVELYKDSSLNVSISSERFFIVNDQVIDKFMQKSIYGVLLVKEEKYDVETGVFTDIGLQQMIKDSFENNE